jgi:hypothetical protein
VRQNVLPVPIRIYGVVTIELRGPSGLIKGRWQFPNLLTNVFKNALGTAGTSGIGANKPFGTGCYIAMGTGTAAPVATDTTLTAEVAPAASNRSNTDTLGISSTGYTAGATDYCYARVARRFSATQAVGTLGEMGLFDASSAGNMWAKAQVKDAAGTPTTIVKASGDTLDIIWEIRFQPLQGDATATVTINGSSYTATYRAANVNTTAGNRAASFFWDWDTAAGKGPSRTSALVTRTSAITAAADPSVITLAAYTAGNFYRDYVVRFAANAAAIALIPTSAGDGAALGVQADSLIQVGLSPVLPAGQDCILRVSWS